MPLNRRRFLGFSAGAVAGAAAGVPVGRTLSDLMAATEQPVFPPRGPESTVLSVCRLCPGGCGVRVRRVGTRAVKVDGNPLHPVNRGRLCPKGQAVLQGLYHPDRLAGPLRRVGPKGSMKAFAGTSWEEALSVIASRLGELRASGRPESVALIRGVSRGLDTRLARRFLEAFGSPNDVTLDRGEDAAALALELGQGIRAVPAYDVAAADYILSFGGALLEAWSSPAHMMHAYGEFRQGRLGRRGKLVQVEPRRSITASSADEWIAVRPGTEGVLALGLARVLIAEGLYNREFVRLRTSGLNAYQAADGSRREGLRDLLEREYGLARVSAQTGVSVSVILRIARELGSARAGLAVGPRKGPLLPGPLFDHLATQVLNALVGNIDSEGGLLVADEVPLGPWPALRSDSVAEQGRARPRLDGAGRGSTPMLESDPEQLAENLLDSTPVPLEALFVLGADPAFASAAPERLASALERVPLVVSFASLPDDTAVLADWILPEPHFLERWDLDTTPPGVAYPVVSLARPVVEPPLHDVRTAAEVFLELAHRLGGKVAAAFEWRSLNEVIRRDVDGLFSARRGASLGTEFDEAWVRMMERSGWWAPGYRTDADLWRQMQETGGWWDPFYDHGDWQRVLATPSAGYEFRTDVLQQLAAVRAVSTDVAETSEPSPSLSLVLFEPLPVSAGRGAELPFLQEILDPAIEERWRTWVEIHPETAAELGVHEHDLLRVASSTASIEVPARVTSRVVAGCAAIPVGLGRREGGRWARGRGANPLRLISSSDRDPGSGMPNLDGIRVRVSVLSPHGERRS